MPTPVEGWRTGRDTEANQVSPAVQQMVTMMPEQDEDPAPVSSSPGGRRRLPRRAPAAGREQRPILAPGIAGRGALARTRRSDSSPGSPASRWRGSSWQGEGEQQFPQPGTAVTLLLGDVHLLISMSWRPAPARERDSEGDLIVPSLAHQAADSAGRERR